MCGVFWSNQSPQVDLCERVVISGVLLYHQNSLGIPPHVLEEPHCCMANLLGSVVWVRNRHWSVWSISASYSVDMLIEMHIYSTTVHTFHAITAVIAEITMSFGRSVTGRN